MADSNVYTAEKILKERVRGGVLQYLIKWQGYSQRDCTWEPKENILDPGLLESYEKLKEKRLKTKSTPKPKQQQQQPVASPQLLTVPSPHSTPQPKLETPPPPSPAKSEPARPVSPPKADSPRRSASPPKAVQPASPPKPVVQQLVVQQMITPPKPLPAPVVPNSKVSDKQTSPLKPQLQPKRSIHKRFALDTVITDVTVNDKTVTICEARSNAFFNQGSRNSVDATTQF